MTKRNVELKDLKEFAKEFLNNLSSNCVALHGNLGAGKTSFTQEVAKVLGVKEEVISPTFLIMREYDIPGDKKFKKLIHIDAYRLQNEDDLKVFNIKDLISNPEFLIFIEWPERLDQDTLQNCQKLHIENISETCREFSY